jgi:chorismate mutase
MMITLQQARALLNQIDEDMITIFELYQSDHSVELYQKLHDLRLARLEVIKDVALYKFKHKLPIYDPQRERELIDRNCRLLKDQKNISSYLRFIEDILVESKQYQEKLITSLCHDE